MKKFTFMCLGALVVFTTLVNLAQQSSVGSLVIIAGILGISLGVSSTLVLKDKFSDETGVRGLSQDIQKEEIQAIAWFLASSVVFEHELEVGNAVKNGDPTRAAYDVAVAASGVNKIILEKLLEENNLKSWPTRKEMLRLYNVLSVSTTDSDVSVAELLAAMYGMSLNEAVLKLDTLGLYKNSTI